MTWSSSCVSMVWATKLCATGYRLYKGLTTRCAMDFCACRSCREYVQAAIRIRATFVPFWRHLPLWNVYETFSYPGKIMRQIAQMPDGRRYLWIARTVNHHRAAWGQPGKMFAIGLGCEIRHAERTVYSDGLDLQDVSAAVPIGSGCRLCPREACPSAPFLPFTNNWQSIRTARLSRLTSCGSHPAVVIEQACDFAPPVLAAVIRGFTNRII